MIVNQFTFARRYACYSNRAGDFRGPVTGAVGTRYFEPDGVFFLASIHKAVGVTETLNQFVTLDAQPA